MSVAITGGTAVIGARVVKNVAFAPGVPFWRACQGSLSAPEFNQLVDLGYCFHKFPNGIDLMFTFRAEQEEEKINVSLDVFDLAAKTLVGILDFDVKLGQGATMHRRLELWESLFSEGAVRELVRAGFPADDLGPGQMLRQMNFNEAFQIRPDYQQREGQGFDHLSHVMMSTAIRVSKGLGVDILILVEVDAGRLQNYYEREFGAEFVGERFGWGMLRIDI